MTLFPHKIHKIKLVILEQYLVESASKSEITNAVAEAISETGASSIKEMGLVMKVTMARLAEKLLKLSTNLIFRHLENFKAEITYLPRD